MNNWPIKPEIIYQPVKIVKPIIIETTPKCNNCGKFNPEPGHSCWV